MSNVNFFSNSTRHRPVVSNKSPIKSGKPKSKNPFKRLARSVNESVNKKMGITELKEFRTKNRAIFEEVLVFKQKIESLDYSTDFGSKKEFKQLKKDLVRDPIAFDMWLHFQLDKNNPGVLTESLTLEEIILLRQDAKRLDRTENKSAQEIEAKLQKLGHQNPYKLANPIDLLDKIGSLQEGAIEDFPFAMMLDFDKIPKMKPGLNATNCTQYVVGDMHGNAELFLHELVQAGYVTIKDETAWCKLMDFINTAVPKVNQEELAQWEQAKEEYTLQEKEALENLEKIADVPGGYRKFTEADSQKLAALEAKLAVNRSPEEKKEFNILKLLKYLDKHVFEGAATTQGDFTLKLQELQAKRKKATRQDMVFQQHIVTENTDKPNLLSYGDPIEMQKKFQCLLSTAIQVNPKAQPCQLVPLGDFFGDRGQNDLFNLNILKMLKTEGVTYQMPFSNHDGEFMVWYHAECDLTKVTHEHSSLTVFRDSHGAVSSLISLDALCRGNPEFVASLRKDIEEVYIKNLTLFPTSPGGKILYSHTPAATWICEEFLQELPDDQVDKTKSFSQNRQAINQWFSGIIGNKTEFEKYFLMGDNAQGNGYFKSLMRLVNSAGGSDRDVAETAQLKGDTNTQFDLALPRGFSRNVHGHIAYIGGKVKLTVNPKIQGTDQDQYLNFEEREKYISLDGKAGMPGVRKGIRFFFAIPDWKRGGNPEGGSEKSVEAFGQEDSYKSIDDDDHQKIEN